MEVRLAKYNIYNYIWDIIDQSNWSGPFSLVVMTPDQESRVGSYPGRGTRLKVFIYRSILLLLHTDKYTMYYDGTKMRTRQKQRVATDTWRSVGCRIIPLKHWGKRKPTVEPRWAKQQTKKLQPQPTKINSFMSGLSLSLTRPTGVGSKVINRDWVTTKHADCRIIFMLYPMRLSHMVIFLN